MTLFGAAGKRPGKLTVEQIHKLTISNRGKGVEPGLLVRHNSKSEQTLKSLKIGAKSELLSGGLVQNDIEGSRRVLEDALGRSWQDWRVLERLGGSNEIRDISKALLEIPLPCTLFYSFLRNDNDANLSSSDRNEQNIEIHHIIIE